jgi:hypothetical protein
MADDNQEQQDQQQESGSQSGGAGGSGTAVKAAAAAAATGVAALAAKKALSGRSGSNGSGNGSSPEGKGEGSVLNSVLSGGWEAARDALLPAAEDAAGAAGEYVAQHGPEILRERIVPRFVDSFNEARGGS